MVQTKPLSYSEDIFNEKWDLCLSNAVIKAGVGLGGGIVASVCLFKRKMWPVTLGFGFGLGKAYSDCDRYFNPYSIPGIQVQKSSALNK
ncbi:hypothetical protein PMAC_001822 [Pneumocystis sp. 'macacae']|nr:hypothetical protein PMAC_001822 [Pneumocystis sp. 'macacae']